LIEADLLTAARAEPLRAFTNEFLPNRGQGPH